MTKRLLAVFAAVMMMFTLTISVSAADGELVLNGGFEEKGLGWSIPAQGEYVGADEAYEGEGALKISSDGNAFADQSIAVKPGAEYTVTFYAKSDGAKAQMKLQHQTPTKWHEKPFEGGWDIGSEWKKITFKAVMPDDVIKTSVMIRLIGGGTIYYDNVSIVGPIPSAEENQALIDKANEEAKKKAKEAAERAARIPSVPLEETLPEDGSYPIVVNGGFEAGTTGWSCPQECERVGIVDDPGNAYEGNAAMKIDHPDNCFFTQVIKLVGGENYKLSFYAKSGDRQVRGVVKLQVYATNHLVAEIDQGWDVGSNWKKYEWTFTAPEGATSSDLMMRLIGGGVIYYDNIKLEGPVSEEVSKIYDELINGSQKEQEEAQKHELMPAIGEANVIKGDPTMETLDDAGYPVGVEVYGGWGQNATVTDDAHSGKNAVMVESYSGGYPWMRMQAPDLIGGATYQLTFWYKAQNISNDKGIQVKFEGYTDNTARGDNGCFSIDTMELKNTDEWKQFVYTVQIPDNCGMLLMYPRVYASIGTLVVDDMALYIVKMPTMSFDTDQVFYYEDLEQGVAKSILAPAYDPAGFTCDFQLYKGATKLAEQLNVPYNEDNEAGFVFSLSHFDKILEEYTLIMTGKDPEGNVLETKKQPLYKIQRPSMLTKDGNFIVEGKPFYPAMLYHGGDYTTWELAAKNGINVFQMTGGPNPETIATLDKAYAAGIKVGFVLYHGMRAAGDPTNIEYNKELVAALKDHPAIFCWMTMDEPNAHYTDKEELDEIMRNGYKAIKEIDNVHPIYHCEASTDKYAWGLKYNDSMGIDPYPGSFSPYETHVADKTAYAEELASKYGKGIIQILQVFTFGYGETATPTEEQVNSMMHQSVMGGADANGYYPWVMDSPAIDGPSLDRSIYWPVVTNFVTKEYDLVWKHYGKHFDTKWFQNIRNNDNWVDMWVDGDVVYAIALNRLKTDQVITIPTTSQNGKVALGECAIEAVNGDAISVEKTAAGFDVKLGGGTARIFKLTPAAAVDYTNLFAFGDIDNYTWAADAINAMYAADIANDKGAYIYEPATPITRGDFAMYLIKALGLDKVNVTNDSFNDVDVDAEYALALSIGKKVGILKGVGDNNYNPEAPITRQDLMVICARGMRVAKAMADGDVASLDAFSDKALIADYATADIAAMVRESIVKGNADGTINPVGNTTRAEAAIIMQRITAWK